MRASVADAVADAAEQHFIFSTIYILSIAMADNDHVRDAYAASARAEDGDDCNDGDDNDNDNDIGEAMATSTSQSRLDRKRKLQDAETETGNTSPSEDDQNKNDDNIIIINHSIQASDDAEMTSNSFKPSAHQRAGGPSPAAKRIASRVTMVGSPAPAVKPAGVSKYISLTDTIPNCLL